MPFWKILFFAWSFIEVTVVSADPGPGNVSCQVFKKVVHYGESNGKSRSLGVLQRLEELPQEVRQDFAEYISELRAYEPEILGLPVYERVYFEYLRSGQDKDAAKKAKILIEDFPDVFQYYVHEVAAIDPADAGTIYVDGDTFSKMYSMDRPTYEQLREKALNLKFQFMEKINAAQTKGWMSYEDYVDVGIKAGFLNTLGITEAHLLAFREKNKDMTAARTLEEMKARGGFEVAHFGKGGMMRFNQYRDFVLNKIFPENVYAFVRAGQEGHISSERVVVPGTHTYVGELTSDLKRDNRALYFPLTHSEHDLFHADRIKEAYRGDSLEKRREHFKSWMDFRNVFLPLTQTEPEVYSVLIENSSYENFHELGKQAHSLNELYLNLHKAKKQLEIDKTPENLKKLKTHTRAMSFIAEKAPSNKWLEEKSFYDHQCLYCRSVQSVQELYQLSHDLKVRDTAGLFKKTAREMRVDLSELQNEIDGIPKRSSSFYLLNFLLPIIQEFKNRPVTWGDLEDIAMGKLKIDGYFLPDQLALRHFLNEVGLLGYP